MDLAEPVRLPIDAALARRLVDAQFPRWAGLPIRPVDRNGWDNHTFRLGADLLVRVPSAAPYAQAVAKEHRWLPVLAPHLPLPIPEVVALGRPGEGYPHPWSVYRWIEGSPPRAPLDESFAVALAGFLRALGRVDPAGGPEPGLHNWFRGGPLQTYDEDMRSAAGKMDDAAALVASWQASLDATDEAEPVWFHGDVATGNLLTRDGHLSAVIDFGTCGIGDPACDLAIAWTSMTPSTRALFRDRMSADPAMWLRGRGWALWKATITGDRPVIDRILAES